MSSGVATRIGHWIAGQAVESGDEGAIPVYDPALGRQIGEVDIAGADLVDAAVSAAADAFPDWAATSLSRRTRILYRFRDLFETHSDQLAALITAEQGKTASDAAGEVSRGLDVIEYACGIPQLIQGRASTNVSTGVDTSSLRQPLGVVAGVAPFNFPAMVPAWMYPLALACGNTFVLKPSERDPSPSLLVAELWREAGLPPGVFNVINGDRFTVDGLLADGRVKAVSFVGSTPAARHVYENGIATGKRVQALAGAKNHLVACADADLAVAADAAIASAFGAAGERCMAISVLVALDAIADQLVAEVVDRARALRVGPGADPRSDLGPLITAAHRDSVHAHVEAAERAGARVLVDGRDLEVPGHPDGYWFGPTVLDGVTPDMQVYRHEVFGPVLCVVRVPTQDAALDLVNGNPWGNGAAVFTRDGGTARRFELELEAGMIGVNVPIPVPVAYYSFGGWKDSLFGDHHIHGPEGIQFYTRGKVVTRRWPNGVRGRGATESLSFPAAR